VEEAGESGMGGRKRLRVDMQGKAGPPEGIAICGALFTARRSDMGTLLSLLCFRRGVPMYYPRAVRFRLHPHLTIPPCGPSIRPRNCTNGRQFRDIEDLAGYWIGGLPVYQAGGPPPDFEKTGGSLWGLRGDVGETWHCHREKAFPVHYGHLPLRGTP